MIRIVGVQRGESPDQEFILLQNQGGLRLCLRGHVVLSESVLDRCDLSANAHIFNDDVLIPAGMYVILHSGNGERRWARTKDGAMVYYVYMNRQSPVWDRCLGSLHVLSTQHTYAERRESELVGARMV